MSEEIGPQALVPLFELNDDERSGDWLRGFEMGAHTIRMMVDEEYDSYIYESNADAIIRCAGAMGKQVYISEPDSNRVCLIQVRPNRGAHN